MLLTLQTKYDFQCLPRQFDKVVFYRQFCTDIVKFTQGDRGEKKKKLFNQRNCYLTSAANKYSELSLARSKRQLFVSLCSPLVVNQVLQRYYSPKSIQVANLEIVIIPFP